MSLVATLCPPARTNRFRHAYERPASARPRASRCDKVPRTDRPSLEQTGAAAPGSDEELLARYRDTRRPDDFAELFRRYAAELSRYLARYLGDAAMGEDVLQDTFLLVHTKCHLYQDGWPARPWLYAVAMHRAVDALRRARRLPSLRIDTLQGADESASLVEVLSSEEPDPLETLEERDRQQWVRASLSKLPDPLRQALVLTYYQGLSYAEAARLLQVPLGTVKSRVHNAVARMRAMAERTGRSWIRGLR